MSIFIDTAVLMYAGGRAHPLREPCRRILDMIVGGRLEAVTSAEVVQEILHRFTAIGSREVGAQMARDALDLFSPVLPISHSTMERMPDLVTAYENLTARDLVHVATCLEHGVNDIVSPDRGFDVVQEIRRIEPDDL